MSETDPDTISFKKEEGEEEKPSDKVEEPVKKEEDEEKKEEKEKEKEEEVKKEENDDEIKIVPGSTTTSVDDSAAAAADTTTTTTQSDDVVEIPKGAITEDYDNCFVEAWEDLIYRPAPYKGPAPKPSISKADAIPKEEPQPAGGFAYFMKVVRDGVLGGQKERTNNRCKKTMKLFHEVPLESAPYLPNEDVVPIIDFRCNCVIDCNVNNTKVPFLASGWITVTKTALIYDGFIIISPARPSSANVATETDVAFAIDLSSIVSVVAAQCPDAYEPEVLGGLKMPSIIECPSVDEASALILFDRSGHAHQFYDFEYAFSNYAPDAIRSIVSQCNLPESAEPSEPASTTTTTTTTTTTSSSVAVEINEKEASPEQ